MKKYAGFVGPALLIAALALSQYHNSEQADKYKNLVADYAKLGKDYQSQVGKYVACVALIREESTEIKMLTDLLNNGETESRVAACNHQHAKTIAAFDAVNLDK
jgi:hypothetical protein